jgi:putative superfamily III holin-X
MGWLDLIRSLGSSLIEVFRAEADALKAELARSGRHLGVGLALLGGAAVLLFWTLGALIFTLGAVLAIWLQVWAAALIVVALFAAAAGLVAWLGVKHLKRFENPAESIRRRLEDHLDWWQHTLLKEERPIDLPPAEEAAARGRRLP